MKRHVSFALLMLAAAGNVHAQSGHRYKLNWNVPGEELTYRSCGCADSCWVAEVRSTKYKERAVATLRCDCQKLYFSDVRGKEAIISESCAPFDEDDKMELIADRIKALRSGARGK
jgi:hypothetical protein